MDFRDTPEQAAFRATVRQWLADTLPADRPAARAGGYEDSEGWLQFMVGWAATLKEAGYAALGWPTEFGGGGASAIEQTIFAEEVSRADAPFHIDIVGLGIAGPTLIVHGSEAQKRRYLPTILDGSEMWCQLWSEPNAGSDLASVTTRAERDGDAWRVSGQKVWTTLAQLCRWGLLLSRSDPNAAKHAGLTAFVCDMQSDGVDVRPLRGMDGVVEFNEVFLDDVLISDVERVGEPGEGWKVITTSLMLERFAVGVGAINYGDNFDDVLRTVVARGRTSDPIVRDRLARLYTDTLLLRVLGYRLATTLDSEAEAGPEGSILKLAGSEFNVRLHEFAVATVGADGLLADTAVARRFLRSPGTTIEGGTSNIQRNILAERVLGLPRDPKPPVS